jgi:hypothetical protein
MFRAVQCPFDGRRMLDVEGEGRAVRWICPRCGRTLVLLANSAQVIESPSGSVPREVGQYSISHAHGGGQNGPADR